MAKDKMIGDKRGRVIRGFMIGGPNDFGVSGDRDVKFDYNKFERILMKKPEIKNSGENEYAEAKRKILMECGYTYLIGYRGKRIDIKKPVNPSSYTEGDRKYASRICSAFQNQKNALEGRIGRYWEEADSMVLDSYY